MSGAEKLGFILLYVEAEFAERDMAVIGVVPLFPDDLVIVTAHVDVNAATASPTADRLCQTDRGRSAQGQQGTVRGEQPVGIFTGPLVEHLADHVLAVNVEAQFKLMPWGLFRGDHGNGESMWHLVTVAGALDVLTSNYCVADLRGSVAGAVTSVVRTLVPAGTEPRSVM